MKLALIGFVLRRVRTSLSQLIWTHMLTAGTMAMTLFVLGGFMLLEANLQQLLKGWGEQVQITAYLANDLEPGDVAGLLERIQALPEIQSVRHITREQAWRDFQMALGTQSGLLEGLPREILPSSIEISLKPPYRDAVAVRQLAERLKKEREIAAVEYPQEWVDRLGLFVLIVEWSKWIFAALLFLITFFIVNSTVKLAVLARREEVEILQLVGASEELIQAPFVIEGMILGLAGALVAIAGLGAGYLFVRHEWTLISGLFSGPAEMQFLDLTSLASLLVLGWLLGAIGSVVSLRRFLRTWHASASPA